MAILNRVRRLSGCAFVAVCVVVCATPATGQAPLENDVKAVFLFNFAKYVDWPDESRGTSATLRMCVPANPQFLSTLRAAVQGETVSGRPLAAIELDGLDGARECHVLYVGDASTADAAEWLNAVRGRHTLTVGDGALADGQVIAFVKEQNRIRFDVSLAAATRQKLTISSRLLGLARKVVQP